MNCEIARHLKDTNDPALAQHQLSCLSCIMRTQARYYEAPPGLEQKIRQSLRQEISTPSSWRWLAIAASVLLVASGTWNIVLLRSRADPQQLLAANVLSAHVRSLSGTHLLDVPSSDQHTVKPWFNGKLDFCPGS
jgi:anti-sigma factor RsiW